MFSHKREGNIVIFQDWSGFYALKVQRYIFNRILQSQTEKSIFSSRVVHKLSTEKNLIRRIVTKKKELRVCCSFYVRRVPRIIFFLRDLKNWESVVIVSVQDLHKKESWVRSSEERKISSTFIHRVKYWENKIKKKVILSW